jgi:hypothetical protein
VNAISNDTKSGPALFHPQLVMRESRHEAKTPDEIDGQFDCSIWRTIMSQRTTTGPARPFDILFPRLAEFRIPRTLCQILRKDATFQEIEFRFQQIAYAREIAEGEHDISISINALAKTGHSSIHEIV